MMRTNESPTLWRARKEIRSSLKLVHEDQIAVVALSGGADSLALAFAASLEGVRFAHIIDHQLQEATAQVSQAMKNLVESWGMTCIITKVDVNGEGGVEASAREARYEALLADPSHVILLGHTMRDQAETVLMGLGRGSGSRSLQGMKAVSREGRVIRPLLTLKRSDTETICNEFNLPYWDDPHNDCNDYRRVRVRTELIPLMEEILGGGVEEALSRTAFMLQEDNSFIEEKVENAFTTDCKALAELKPTIRRRIIREFLLSSGAKSERLSQKHILGVESLITDWRGQKGVSVAGGLMVRRAKNKLVVDRI